MHRKKFLRQIVRFHNGKCSVMVVPLADLKMMKMNSSAPPLTQGKFIPPLLRYPANHFLVISPIRPKQSVQRSDSRYEIEMARINCVTVFTLSLSFEIGSLFFSFLFFLFSFFYIFFIRVYLTMRW